MGWVEKGLFVLPFCSEAEGGGEEVIEGEGIDEREREYLRFYRAVRNWGLAILFFRWAAYACHTILYIPSPNSPCARM